MVWKIPTTGSLLTWPYPNYINPVRRGPEMFIISGLFTGLSTIAVLLRLYARLWVRRWFGLDDVFVILGWLSAIGVTTSVLFGVTHLQWDRHTWDVTWENIVESGKPLYIALMFWAVSSSFTRLSLLCFYYRLIEHINLRRYRFVLHLVVIISVLFFLAYITALSLVCIPLYNFWSSDFHAKCFNLGTFLFSVTIVSTCLELVIALLPVPIIFTLQMNKSQQWSVACLLSLGVLTTGVGCVRTFLVYKALISSDDVVWWSEPHFISSEVENSVALVCACAPALRPLLGRMIGQSPLQSRLSTTSFGDRGSQAVSSDDMNKEKLHMSNSTLIWFDLEGIAADDGLGYSVSITTANGGPEGTMVRNNPIGGFRLGSRAGNRRTFRSGPFSRSRRSSRPQKHHPRHPSQELTETENRIEIFETRSVEVRESYHDVRGSEEIRVWKSGSEQGDNHNLGRFTPIPEKGNAERSQSPQMAKGVTQNLNADNSESSTPPQPLPAPEAAVVRQSSTRSSKSNSQWLSPPGSPRRRPIHTLNTSQYRGSPHSPRSRLSVASSRLDEDTSFMLEIATMRDILHWTQVDGSMYAEDGSINDQTPEGDNAV